MCVLSIKVPIRKKVWKLIEVTSYICKQVLIAAGSFRRLLRRGLEFHVCTINKSAHTKKVWKLIEVTSYICKQVTIAAGGDYFEGD